MDITERAMEAACLVRDKLPIMVLTGAGISVGSNIPTFRGENGLWSRYDPFEYGHIDTFRRDPAKTWVLLKEMMRSTIGAKPNEAHISLARMESKGWVGPIVTQNVDGLHIMAGSRDVLEVHGNIRRLYCPSCGERKRVPEEHLDEFEPLCVCGSYIRPDIVLFGEQLPFKEFRRALVLAEKGRSMLIIGTSGVVQPAASLPIQARMAGGIVIEINPAPSELTGSISNVFIQACATEGIDAFERALEDVLERSPMEPLNNS